MTFAIFGNDNENCNHLNFKKVIAGKVSNGIITKIYRFSRQLTL